MPKHRNKSRGSKRVAPLSFIAILASVVTSASAETVAEIKKAKEAANAAAKAKEAEAAAASSLAEKKLKMSLWERLDVDFREQMGSPCFVPPEAPASGGKAVAATPGRRGLPAPYDGPPFPTAEWQLGGSPIIGDAGVVAPSPLMQALYDGPHGDAIKASRVQFYGWEDVSVNTSTSHNTSRGQSNNFPEAYDSRSNKLEQNQFVMYLERVPDEFQTDHMDWGFRLAAVYGLDYRYMISRGFNSDQLIKSNKYYGWDFPMMYFDWYIPWIGEGTNVRVGRLISLADIEAQLAPNNLMSSHSLMYAFDPYTMWGIFTTTKLNKNWTVQLGLSGGNDVAPWQSDPGRQLTGTVMLQWISNNNKDSIYGGANSFNNAHFGYNNINQFVATWTHTFNDKIWTSTETWYMYQIGATTGPTYDVPYQNGAFPVTGGQVHEWSVLNYTMYRTGPGSFLTLRNEVFDDCSGNRTGYKNIYSEHSLGFTWWPNKIMTIRPEIRFDHAYNVPAFDNGLRKNQFSAQIDVVLHF